MTKNGYQFECVSLDRGKDQVVCAIHMTAILDFFTEMKVVIAHCV